MKEPKCENCIWNCGYEYGQEREMCSDFTMYQEDYTYQEETLKADYEYWEEWNAYIKDFN